MKKKQLSVLLSNIFSVIVNLGVSFFIIKYLFTKVGKDVYSFYPMSTNVANYFGLITVALNALSFRFVAVYLLNEDKKKAQAYYASVFWTNILMAVVISLGMSWILWRMDTVFEIPPGFLDEVRELFMYSFLTFLLNNIFNIFSVYGYVCNKMDILAYLDIFTNFIKLAIYIYLLKTEALTIAVFGLSSLLVAVIKGLFNAFYIRRILPDFHVNLSSFSGSLIRESLKSGIWISVSNGGMMLLNNISLVVANIYLGVGGSGDLSLVSVLCSISTMLISTFSAVFAPRITASVYSEDSSAKVRKEIRSLELMNMLFVVIPIAILCFMGADFYRLWIQEEYHPRLHILSILVMLPLLWQGIANVVRNISLSIDEIKIPSLLLVGSGIANIFLMILFLGILNWGIVGIPLATGITGFVYYVWLLPKYVHRKFREIRLDYTPDYLYMLAVAMLLVVLHFVFCSTVRIENYIHLLTYGALLYGISVALVWLLHTLKDKRR